MIATALATLALFSPAADAWELKPTFAPKAVSKYSVVVRVDINSEEHTATFEQVFTTKEAAKSGDWIVNAEWNGIMLDDSQDMGSNAWEVLFAPQGGVMKSQAEEGDSIRRMFSPLAFIYPKKAVEPGAKWGEDLKAPVSEAKTVSYTFEVLGAEKVKDVEALKIGSKMSEKDGDLNSDGTWWVARDGKILKYEVRIRNWIVPMSGGEPFDATFKAELKEAK